MGSRLKLVLFCAVGLFAIPSFAATETLEEVVKGMEPTGAGTCLVMQQEFYCIRTIRDEQEYLVVYDSNRVRLVIRVKDARAIWVLEEKPEGV